MTSTRCLSAALALTGAALTAAPAAANFDVAVGEIHVTQGIQHNDPIFRVALVAERSTAVRVHVVRVTGTPTEVTGRLHVLVDGVRVTPPHGVPDLNRTLTPPFIPPNIPQYFNALPMEESTLNFELPSNTLPLVPGFGQTETDDVDIVVEISAVGDTNPDNNVGTVTDLTLTQRAIPRIFTDQVFFVADCSAPPGSTPPDPVPPSLRPDPTFIARGRGDQMVTALWPIADRYPSTMFPLLLNGVYFAWDCDCDGKITLDTKCFDPQGNLQGTEQGRMLAKLAVRRQLLVSNGLGPDMLTYLYGWVKDGFLSGHDGISQGRFSHVGYGTDRPEKGQMVFAHEFGHMLGFDHNIPGQVVGFFGWDVGARLHHNPMPMTGATGRVKEAHVFKELMNDDGSMTTATAWIGDEHYNAALTDPLLSATSTSACVENRTFETYVVYGVLESDYAGVRYSTEVLKYPWCTVTFAHANPTVRITLSYERPDRRLETIVVPIDPRLPGGGAGEPLLDYGPFAVPVPVPPGSRLVSARVDAIKGDFKSTVITPSKTVPTLQIAGLASGSTIGPRVKLSWKSADPDAGAKLTYQVAYSPNGGKDFVPVDVDLETTTITIDTTRLPRADKGAGLFRVFANDGAHTSFADVGGLTMSAR